jgi:sarcosine oxidase, subunit beta
MSEHFDTVVIGGGCLGSAAALAIARRRVAQGGSPNDVCLVDKVVLGSGVSARHSGIVRAANADRTAAELAKASAAMWTQIADLWGVSVDVEKSGALWIARDSVDPKTSKWHKLETSLRASGIAFGRISLSEARQKCPDLVKLNADEVFYFEPEALQIDPLDVRKALYGAIHKNHIPLREKTEVVGFERGANGSITSVITTAGRIGCNHVINAAGPWSPSIFASLNISIPVSVEPVCVANWVTSLAEMPVGMPIIADYVNLAYFRRWRDGEIHMHQPRKRGTRETARAFSENALDVVGADFMNEPNNQSIGNSQIQIYQQIARRRFTNLDLTVFGSGYRAYFDITPDLRFILGPDHRVSNLIHCLGSGQAFKYAPVLGEMMADYVTGSGRYAEYGNEFLISRFNKAYMAAFWKRVSGDENDLEVEAVNL